MPAQATYTTIQTITAANSSSNDYSFTNIPATYTDLVVVAQVRGVASQATQQFAMYLGDASTLFQSTQNSYNSMFGNGTSAGATRTNNASGMFQYGGCPGGTSTANTWGVFTFHIMNYANTNMFKTIISRNGVDTSGSGQAVIQVNTVRTTTAITRVGLATYGDGNLAAGSIFTLYGIKAA